MIYLRYTALSLVLSLALSLMVSSMGAYAAPVVASVETTDVSVTNTGTQTIVSASSVDTAIINWNSFNVAAGETVTFQQKNASSLVVNTILDANPSQILGAVYANGRVVLQNPNGFYFGAGSSVSAHTFVAIAAEQANANWNAANNTVNVSNYSGISGDITQLGSISASRTFLVGKKVNIASTASNFSAAATYYAIQAKEDIILSSSLSIPQGSIDIFTNEGSVTAEGNTVLHADRISITAQNSVEIAEPIVIETAESESPGLSITSQQGSINSGSIPFMVDYGNNVISETNLVLTTYQGDIFIATLEGSNQTANLFLNSGITIGDNGVLSITQTDDSIILNNDFPDRNVRLVLSAPNGSIFGSETVFATSLTLIAQDHIGNPINGRPLAVEVDGSQIIANASYGNVLLEHPQDVGSLFSAQIAVGVYGRLDLYQTYGSVFIRNPLTMPLINTTIVARDGNIAIESDIQVASLTIQAANGLITGITTLTSNRINLTSGGSIGTIGNPIQLEALSNNLSLPAVSISQPDESYSYLSTNDNAETLLQSISASPSSFLHITQLLDGQIFELEIPIPEPKKDTVFVQLLDLFLVLADTECNKEADDVATLLDTPCQDY